MHSGQRSTMRTVTSTARPRDVYALAAHRRAGVVRVVHRSDHQVVRARVEAAVATAIGRVVGAFARLAGARRAALCGGAPAARRGATTRATAAAAVRCRPDRPRCSSCCCNAASSATTHTTPVSRSACMLRGLSDPRRGSERRQTCSAVDLLTLECGFAPQSPGNTPIPRATMPRMTAAILCIGTELTRGEIVNTNATWLSETLTALGFEVTEVECVDDNRGRIQSALTRMGAEHDVIVSTGGLGPTTDDITSECAAAVLGVPLERHAESLAAITKRMERFGRTWPPRTRNRRTSRRARPCCRTARARRRVLPSSCRAAARSSCRACHAR